MITFLPDPIVRRLPIYYRHLKALEAQGVSSLSSNELGEVMRLTPSQIRQDISRIGATGHQGRGYNVTDLKNYIGRLIGADRRHAMILFGAGNIGRAVVRNASFRAEGFEVTAVFDASPEKTGKTIGGLTVRPLGEVEAYLAENDAEIAVLAVPAEAAQPLVDRLSALGIRAFWNFAPIDLTLPRGCVDFDVHLVSTLQVLSCRLMMAQNKS